MPGYPAASTARHVIGGAPIEKPQDRSKHIFDDQEVFTMKHNMKKTITLAVALLVLGVLFVFSTAAEDLNAAPPTPDTDWYNPTGTEFTIFDAYQLAGLAALVNDGTDYFLDKTITLDADLDLSAWNDGTGWTPIGKDNSRQFRGTFDGDGHTVTGLYINDPSSTFVGLFGVNAVEGTIKNIGVIDADIVGDQAVGGVVGYNMGIIATSYNTGDIEGGTWIGGVVGYNLRGTITASYNTGSIRGDSNIGGVAGEDYRGPITASYNTGDVTGRLNVGGVVGWNYDGSITASYNTGSISGDSNVGGVSGRNGSTITRCYWAGNAAVAVGYEQGTTSETFRFGSGDAWPSGSGDWGVGDSSGTSGNYWLYLGGYSSSTYPVLWFETITFAATSFTESYSSPFSFTSVADNILIEYSTGPITYAITNDGGTDAQIDPDTGEVTGITNHGIITVTASKSNDHNNHVATA
ncbi:MAG: hypothetical protein LBV63_00750, partial [Candidatus Methanoplasma sp.]|nr:hypothetical protein [Candidatus Methanoplasma sp.]